MLYAKPFFWVRMLIVVSCFHYEMCITLHYCSPAQEDPRSFRHRQRNGQIEGELTAFLRHTSWSTISCHCWSPNADNFVSAGIITTRSVLVGCLLRLEPNLQTKVSVKWRVCQWVSEVSVWVCEWVCELWVSECVMCECVSELSEWVSEWKWVYIPYLETSDRTLSPICSTSFSNNTPLC